MTDSDYMWFMSKKKKKKKKIRTQPPLSCLSRISRRVCGWGSIANNGFGRRARDMQRDVSSLLMDVVVRSIMAVIVKFVFVKVYLIDH